MTRFVCRTAEKPRSRRSRATYLQVFVHADWFTAREYRRATGMTLPQPMDDSLRLSRLAGELLARIYRPGHGYKNAGVPRLGLVSREERQLGFDSDLMVMA